MNLLLAPLLLWISKNIQYLITASHVIESISEEGYQIKGTKTIRTGEIDVASGFDNVAVYAPSQFEFSWRSVNEPTEIQGFNFPVMSSNS